ncbi:unnamed protein product [Prorocentrum cordatum]|uniref:non-specific serine/threonine protein kinase n=1 Tax=Prorocentrum cordatum TaxID=2364126 RepID=A0ABN9WTZ4_9DINO|nr:unnamed protein product [Polarella glacialis]
MAVGHRDLGTILKKRGYTEVRKIGEGSFGKAILVHAKESMKLVCKVVDVSKASVKETKAAMQEGQVLASLKHPYIVRYRENFTEAGWFCILMDYCEGGDLTRQIEHARKRREGLAEVQILRWFTQAVLALKYIHDKHILHRDLKPSNFFLSKSGSLKMGDFGIAKVLSCTMACAQTQIGTPYYLSPEVCQEKPYAWPADIWSLGCILYEMCALKVPFNASNISGLVQKICRGPTPTVPPKYSDFIRQLCSEMLSRSPSSRPSSDEVLKRSAIQTIVRQMLQEAQQEPDGRQAARADERPAPRAVPAPGEGTPRPAAAPLPPPPAAGPAAALRVTPPCVAGYAACGPYGDTAGAYRKGDLVEYLSSTHQEWLSATVSAADCAGRVQIDLKPNTWITPEDQATKVRPRRPAAAVRGVATPARGRASQRALEPRGPSPVARRNWAAGALDRNPQRSPSVDGVPGSRNATPVPAERDFSPARFAAGGPGSRANSPRRSPSRGRSPSPSRGGAGAPRCGGAAAASPRLGGGAAHPAGIPRIDSPMRRRNPSLGAAGAAIAGS